MTGAATALSLPDTPYLDNAVEPSRAAERSLAMLDSPPRFHAWHTPGEEARILAPQCLKARVEPEDATSLVLSLASDDARMCTAHEYFVDAGWR